jgi:hypothetical protein
MTILHLKAHPVTPCTWIDTVTAVVDREGADSVTCRYVLGGDIQRLRIPPVATLPARTDGLWRTTCFELFARASPDSGYSEFNFSPSGHWAAYMFEGYRQGMRDLSVAPPAVACVQQAGSLTLTATRVAPGVGAGPIQIAASAVLEDLDGRIYYWALQHPDGKPDFHHAAGFAARG